MKILLCASECAPFVKTGGLADVVGSLPAALNAEGADARVILPKYQLIGSGFIDKMEHVCSFELLLGDRLVFCGLDTLLYRGVRYYFVDNLALFGGDTVYTGDEREGYRYAFFCRAVLEALPRIDFFPDVLQLNDWQTGLIPVLLRGQYGFDPRYHAIKLVYTIHNLRYQGLFDWALIRRLTGLNDGYFTVDNLEFYGVVSFMKAGIVFSDRVTTVSPSYAEEIRTGYYGERLDGLLNKRRSVLSGILNGIDTIAYDPAADVQLPKTFTAADRRGKAVCKKALQKDCRLSEREDVPLIAMVTRLTSQKGLDLVECVLDELMALDVQLLILGMGDSHYENFFQNASRRYPGRVATRIELNEGLAHRVYAGADLFLMPSQFEPCGLSQLIALRYGCIPIVRETGGLRDSIQAYNQYEDSGNGFSFHNYNAHEMLRVTEQAVGYYRSDKALWQRLVGRAMRCDYSWDASAKKYLALFCSLTGQELPKPQTAEADIPKTEAPAAAPAEIPKTETAQAPAEIPKVEAPKAPVEIPETPAPAAPTAAPKTETAEAPKAKTAEAPKAKAAEAPKAKTAEKKSAAAKPSTAAKPAAKAAATGKQTSKAKAANGGKKAPAKRKGH